MTEEEAVVIRHKIDTFAEALKEFLTNDDTPVAHQVVKPTSRGHIQAHIASLANRGELMYLAGMLATAWAADWPMKPTNPKTFDDEIEAIVRQVSGQDTPMHRRQHRRLIHALFFKFGGPIEPDVIDDVATHANAWDIALKNMMRYAIKPDDFSYWQHERAVLERLAKQVAESRSIT